MIFLSSLGLVAGTIAIPLLIWVCGCVYRLVKVLWSFQTAAAKIHNLPRHWLLGTLPKIKEIGYPNMLPYFVEEVKKHKLKTLIFWRGRFNPNVLVTHPKSVGEILRTTEPKNRSFQAIYNLIQPWVGEGLLVSSGRKWERNRKLLTPAFHCKALQPYQKVYNEAADILLSKFKKASCTGESFEVFDPVALCTLDVMLRCAFSFEDNIQEKGGLHPYVRAVKRMATLIVQRDLQPLNYINWIYALTKDGQEFKQHCDYVHTFADEIIEKRQHQLLSESDVNKKPHLDFLDILLAARDEDGVGFSRVDMRAEVDTFLFEGHDTTASGTSWAMYALAKYPDIQEKVYQEVRDVLGDRKDVEMPDLQKMTYTAMFIKEVFRMYTPVPIIGREVSKPLVIDGVELPVGMKIIISLFIMHHNPDVWENPEEFRSERFAEDKFSSRDPYSFVPFSAGPRNCIGQNFALNEEKVLVARIVNGFRLELDTDHEIVMVPELVMRSQNGIKVKVYPRA
ncbi:ultra-long-chain fatty acid omega-hydroxylase-like [Liolophura sinensis]|uniref:ultra-long-chain fatty acid omega-hydroxylase-like n=1 Tax=Liolophura sinensis TaxID=3198878 RepID=UPI0031593E66